jgi:peptidoglycan hydrolase-like protein with peptidoglycan-binding domain
MRFYEIKKLIETEQGNVVVIGDSIAVGIGGAGPYAQGGISAQEVLNRVNSFIQTGKAKGATVILSTGAGNSARFELEDGGEIPSRLGTYPAQQVRALVAAGAKVAVVGAPSKKSTWFPGTSWTKKVRYRVDPTGLNDQLEQAARANGAKFLGPLEQFDPNMHSGNGDGLHPFGGYKKLYQAGSAGASSKTGSADADSTGQTAEVVDGLKAGPPYPREETYMNAVRDLQRKLEKIGYSVGDTGIDGKYGPRTTRAVAAFKKDYEISSSALSVSTKELETLAGVGTKIAKVKTPTPTENQPRTSGMDPEEVAKLTSEEGIKETMKIASNFLGRALTPDEFVLLARVTLAESTSNPQEIAQVAAVILNRVRSPQFPDDVYAVVHQKGQFQPVTGKKINGKWTGPEGSFARGGLAPNELARISKALTDHLPSANKQWLNFTAASSAAYGVGTNIGFRDKMLAQGGKVIGGTVFGTVT